MKHLLIIIFAVFSLPKAIGQSAQDVGKIALSVVMPDNVDGLDVSQLSKLETKILHIVSSAGLAGSGFTNNFVIYPKFAVYETNIVEGGMENITVVNCELSLFIKQVDNNVVFSTVSKQLKGSGKTKSMAITNSISKIPTNDIEFKSFIETGKSKILDYYEAKCSDIVEKSESLVSKHDFEQALGLLMTVPEEVSCFNRVQEKSIKAYKAYQSQKCKEQLQQAKTLMASNNYHEALNVLTLIDPSTPCFNESQLIINDAASNVDAEEKKQWDFKLKKYDDSVALEKERINAVKEIAVAYYKRKPRTVNYLLLIK